MLTLSEFGIGTIASLSIVGLALSSFLYMWGGRFNKAIRRYAGSLVLAATVWMTSYALGKFDLRLLAIYPLLIAAYSMGYGSDILWTKFLRRVFYALAVVSAGLVCVWALGGHSVWVVPFHVLCAAGSVYLGVRNPVHAAAEEVFVSTTLNLGLLAYPFVA